MWSGAQNSNLMVTVKNMWFGQAKNVKIHAVFVMTQVDDHFVMSPTLRQFYFPESMPNSKLSFLYFHAFEFCCRYEMHGCRRFESLQKIQEHRQL